MSLIEMHRQAMRVSVEAVALIHDQQWELPTPCAKWTLRDLVAHMTSENHGFAAAADGETEDRGVWTFRQRDEDLRIDYARSAEHVVGAFGADGVLDRQFWLPRINDAVTFPAPQAIGFHLLDYVVHSWDVGATLGPKPVFAGDLIGAVSDIARQHVPDGPRRRRPGAGFQPSVQVLDDWTEQDRLLAALGRSPTWPS